MPAKNGQQYIERLKNAKNNVYMNGEFVEDVTEHRAFKEVIKTMAKLYDVQYEKPDKMLYTSPTTGEKVGKTFMVPTTIDELINAVKQLKMANITNGMMGRSPDYLNADVMVMGPASEFFAEGDEFAENARKYLNLREKMI